MTKWTSEYKKQYNKKYQEKYRAKKGSEYYMEKQREYRQRKMVERILALRGYKSEPKEVILELEKFTPLQKAYIHGTYCGLNEVLYHIKDTGRS